MPQPESPFIQFVNSHPDYPNESTANALLFEWIRTQGGNDFASSDSFAKAWVACREEIIETISSKNAEQFLRECPAFIASEFNAGLVDAFIASQVGRNRVWSVENYLAAHDYLKSEFATEVAIETQKKRAPVHPAHSLADAMTARAAEEAALRKLSPIGKPVNKKLRALAVKERRDRIPNDRLFLQDRSPERVEI